MRKLRKSKRRNKVKNSSDRVGIAKHAQEVGPDQAPALSQLLNRIEETNGRMMEKVSCFQQMNDRLLGSNPDHQTGEKLDTTGAVVQQLERQVMVYEMLVTRFSGELERLSHV